MVNSFKSLAGCIWGRADQCGWNTGIWETSVKSQSFLRRASRKIRNVPVINLVINYEEENSISNISLRTGRRLGVPWGFWWHHPIQKLSSLLLWALRLPALSPLKAALGLLCFLISMPSSSDIQSTWFHSQFLPFGFVTTLFLSLKSFFPLLAHNPLLQGRLSYPFSVTTVNSNLTWDWTESCSQVLVMRLESDESLKAFSTPTIGHNCHLLAAFQQAWARGKCCVNGGKQIVISLQSSPFHHDWGILGLMGETRPGAWVSKSSFPLLSPAVIVILLPSEMRNSSDIYYLSASFQKSPKRGAASRAQKFSSWFTSILACAALLLCAKGLLLGLGHP